MTSRSWVADVAWTVSRVTVRICQVFGELTLLTVRLFFKAVFR